MMLDPKVAYWTGAWVNLGVIVTCALLGVKRVRRADYRAHQRLVLTAAWLVLAFLVSYVIKLEDGSEQPMQRLDDSPVFSYRHRHKKKPAYRLKIETGGEFAGNLKKRFNPVTFVG